MSINDSRYVQISKSVITSIGRDQNNINITSTPLPALLRNISTGALYDSTERCPPPQCAPGTRGGVMSRIRAWIADCGDQPVLWLNGPLGHGKSAIAQTAAEFCAAQDFLAGTFFFSRRDEKRGVLQRLVATLACQLAIAIPAMKDYLLKLTDDDPLVFNRPISVQLQKLISGPLHQIEGSMQRDTPLVIIVGGLDECSDHQNARDFLRFFVDALYRHPGSRLQLLFTSRIEPHIQTAVRSPRVRSVLHTLSLLDYPADDDIFVFLTVGFANIAEERTDIFPRGTLWPPLSVVKHIARMADGLFIFADVVLRFIGDPYDRPDRRLSMVLKHEYSAGMSPYAALDQLYHQVLSELPDTHMTRTVLSFFIVPSFLFHMDFVASLSGIDILDIRYVLCRLSTLVRSDIPDESFLTIPPTTIVHLRHDSLAAFLIDKARAGTFHVERDVCRDIYIDLMSRFLRTNDILGQDVPESQLIVCLKSCEHVDAACSLLSDAECDTSLMSRPKTRQHHLERRVLNKRMREGQSTGVPINEEWAGVLGSLRF